MIFLVYVIGTLNLLVLYVTSLGNFGKGFFKPNATTRIYKKTFRKIIETSQESNEWNFHVKPLSFSRVFDN